MIIVISLFKSLTILCLLTFVISCASLEKLKFWGDEEEIELPASLTEFEQSKSIVELIIYLFIKLNMNNCYII